MSLLVDTHCWLWSLLAPERLNAPSREALRDPRQAVFLSVASMWEMTIKAGLGKLSLPLPPSEYIPSRLATLGHQTLPILPPHVFALERMPLHHKDPFDRLLVAQAQVEGLQLVTADQALRPYDVPLLWAGPTSP